MLPHKEIENSTSDPNEKYLSVKQKKINHLDYIWNFLKNSQEYCKY